jgi:hypothetical protein
VRQLSSVTYSVRIPSLVTDDVVDYNCIIPSLVTDGKLSCLSVVSEVIPLLLLGCDQGTLATVARRYRFKELHCSHRRARPVQRCNGLVKPVIYTGVAKSGIIRITAFRPGETILKPAITRFNSLV